MDGSLAMPESYTQIQTHVGAVAMGLLEYRFRRSLPPLVMNSQYALYSSISLLSAYTLSCKYVLVFESLGVP